jgi:hypothetical protein
MPMPMAERRWRRLHRACLRACCGHRRQDNGFTFTWPRVVTGLHFGFSEKSRNSQWGGHASADCFCSAFRKVLQRNGKTSSLWLSGVVDGKITTLQRTQRLQLLREGKLEIKRRLVPGCEPPLLPLTEEDVEQFFGWHD